MLTDGTIVYEPQVKAYCAVHALNMYLQKKGLFTAAHFFGEVNNIKLNAAKFTEDQQDAQREELEKLCTNSGHFHQCVLETVVNNAFGDGVWRQFDWNDRDAFVRVYSEFMGIIFHYPAPGNTGSVCEVRDVHSGHWAALVFVAGYAYDADSERMCGPSGARFITTTMDDDVPTEEIAKLCWNYYQSLPLKPGRKPHLASWGAVPLCGVDEW